MYIQCLLRSASLSISQMLLCSPPCFQVLPCYVIAGPAFTHISLSIGCKLQLMIQTPTPTSPPFPVLLSFFQQLSLSLSLSQSSLEASCFSSFAFSHNAVKRVNGWGAFKRAVGGSGVWQQRVYCLRERDFSLTCALSLSFPLSLFFRSLSLSLSTCPPVSLSLSSHWLHISRLSR